MSSFKRRPSMLARIGVKGDGTEDEPDLDEEMEKVFAPVGAELFKVTSVSSAESLPQPEKHRHRDLRAYKEKNYHQPHKPLRRSVRKRTSSYKKHQSQDPEDSPREEESEYLLTDDTKRAGSPPISLDDPAGVSTPRPSPLRTSRLTDELEASDSEYHSDRRVQFDIDEENGPANTEGPGVSRKKDEDFSEENKSKVKKKRDARKYSMPEYPVWSKKSGDQPFNMRKMSMQAHDGHNLQEIDQDDLTSHRFDLKKEKRRYSVRSKVSQLSLADSRKSSIANHVYTSKKSLDHSPHKLFVQLNELIGFGDDREWKETARWIKYEENIEEGAERWGKPHVATLGFHALINLRRCLETGVMILDLEEKDLPGVVHRVVEQMVMEELILAGDKSSVMRTFLLRHRPVDSERFRFSVRRNTLYTSLQNFQEDARSRPKMSIANIDLQKVILTKSSEPDTAKSNHTAVDMKEETYISSEDLTKKAAKESILKRIPEGSEAAAVLVGAVDFLEQPTTAFVRLSEGIMMPSVTEVPIPVRFLFFLLGPLEADMDYHETGRSISTLLSKEEFQSVGYQATERRELLSAINDILNFSIVMPPGDYDKEGLLPSHTHIKEKTAEIRRRQSRMYPPTEPPLPPISERKKKYPNPLKRTRKPFGGLINDIKRRLPFYISDFLDGLNGQCIAAAIFIYFAALSAAVTFGGLMADKTNNLIGISETLVSTAVAGMLFALLSGQPLVIIGTTGPLLLFDESLYKFCLENAIDYLTIRVYIGFWLLVIALLVSFFEGSVLVKIFTRFISEIFATLISLLYIMESLMKIFALFKKHPLMTLLDYCLEDNYTTSALSTENVWLTNISISSNTTNIEMSTMIPLPPPTIKNQPNTALFCTVLALGTFFIAYYLRHFRNSKFLGRSVRRTLGDFGVPIAIILMVVLDTVQPGTYTEKLKVPEGLSPSNPSVRGWLISPLGLMAPLPLWVAFAAVVPAVLMYILLFLETHISELIIDKKERKLKKGSGFHLDIVLVCLSNVCCGLIGAPFMSAATVRSVAHVSALTVMSSNHAPGEKPFIIEVKEQRLSALLVSLLVGLSVLISPLLRLVPMAVLFGVFLYLGISSIDGIQFIERLRLFFMPVKHHPQVNYVRRVQTMKMHLYTAVQLLCLATLWIVKSSPLSLALPFFLILMVPIRANLSHLFTPLELIALDSDEPDQGTQADEPDFYAESLLAG